VYSLLLLYGRMTAKELANKMNISYNKIYPILLKLEVRGWIRRIGSKPASFEAIDLREVWSNIKILIQEKVEQFEKEFIEPLASMLSTSSTFNIIIIPQNKLIDTIIQMLNTSSSKYLIAISYKELCKKEILDSINALGLNKEVKIILNKEVSSQFSSTSIKPRYMDSIFGSGIITDDGVLLIVKQHNDLSGIYSNHRYLVEIARVYFEYLWNKSSPSITTNQD
ncbi:MAG: helix-turn-helix domain-containing protein, partial [Sulfolobaceae archaeon]